jgi:hypothetical protein
MKNVLLLILSLYAGLPCFAQTKPAQHPAHHYEHHSVYHHPVHHSAPRSGQPPGHKEMGGEHNGTIPPTKTTPPPKKP